MDKPDIAAQVKCVCKAIEDGKLGFRLNLSELSLDPEEQEVEQNPTESESP